MSPDPDRDLARVRALCPALPGTIERISHGAPGFFIDQGKAFAYFRHDHHGDGRTALIVKTGGSDEAELLIAADPAIHFAPAYLGRAGWVGMRTDRPDTDWEHVRARIEASWRHVVPRTRMGGPT